MHRFIAVSTWALIALSASGAPAADSTLEPSRAEIVATYRGGAITQSDYEAWLRHRGVEDAVETREAELPRLALTLWLDSHAQEDGFDALREQKRLLGRLEDRVLAAAYQKHIMKVDVTDEEVEKVVAEIPEERFFRPRRARLSNLSKNLAEGADEGARAALLAEMAALREQILAGADFGELALAHSASTSSERRGNLGWISPGMMAPELERVVMALEPGELTPVLETPTGFVLILCHEVSPSLTATPEERRETVAEELRRERSSGLWQAEYKSLVESVELDLDTVALRGQDPEAVVARFSVGELKLWELQTMGDVAEISDDQLRRKLERYLLDTVAAHRARALGLDHEPEVEESVMWQRRSGLAQALVAQWAKARLDGSEEADLASEALPERVRLGRLEDEIRAEQLEELELELQSRIDSR